MPSRSRRLNVSIVGAGKVGTSLALLLHRRGHRIVSVVSRTTPSARRCARLVRCRTFSTSVSDLSAETQVLLLALPEDSVSSIARAISQQAPLRFDRLFVFHTSGVLSSDILKPLRSRGARVGSIHPVQTFPDHVPVRLQARTMRGIWYGIEVEPGAVARARTLVRDFGGIPLRVPKEGKILYHLACVFASSYPVALLGAIEELTASFLKPPRLRVVRKLLATSIDNAMKRGPAKVVTGPLVRGSDKTVRAHLKQLRRKGPHLIELYVAMARYLLRALQEAGCIRGKDASRLRKALS